jgi:inositol phosphorylceramide mannosyltransferase catalytic subunit
MDPLLVHPVILPKTIPVGVSNDLMFAEKGHPFMAQTIHNLVTFDHSWYLNYPTVMFSTGPMFLSAQYGVYTTAHPAAPEHPGGEVRILPKALYGKNAKPHEAPHAFFAHYYGSSWHSDDAAFVGFLGQWGKGLMFVGAAIVVLGLFRLALPSQHARSRKRGRAYEVVPLHWSQRHGRYQLDLGWFTLPVTPATRPPSPLLPPSPVPSLDEEDMLSLPYPSLPFDLRSRPPSPAPSDRTDIFPSSGAVVDAALRLGGRLATFFGPSDGHDPDGPHQPFPRRAAPSRRVLFMPAVFAPASAEYELPLRRPHRRPRSPPPRYTSPAPTATGGPSSGESKSGQRFGVDEENGLLGISGIGRSEVGSRISSRAITPAATPARIPSSEQPLDAFFDGGQSNMLFPGARTPGSRTPQGSRPSSRLA